MAPRTLFDKIWDSHVIKEEQGKPSLLYVDLHLVHEVTSPQAFDGLRMSGRKVRRPDLTVAVADHNTPTWDLSLPITDPIAQQQLDTLGNNCEEFGLTLFFIIFEFNPKIQPASAFSCLFIFFPKTFRVRDDLEILENINQVEY